MFNSMFANPYAQFLPPAAKQSLQQQGLMNFATAMLQNSYGTKDGVARFGDAMSQFQQSQQQTAEQMTNMRLLAERMRLAQEDNQRRQGVYEGKDFASQEGVRQFNRQDETARRGQDMRAQTSRDIAASRNSLFGVNTPRSPGTLTPEEQMQADIAAVQNGTATPEQARRASEAGAQMRQGQPEAATAPEPQTTPQSSTGMPRTLRPGVALTGGNMSLVKEYAQALKKMKATRGRGDAMFDQLDAKVRATLPPAVVSWIEQNPDEAFSDPSSALYN